MKKVVDIITYKFILVGIINTIFGTAIMFISYNTLNLSYWISSALNYILGSILSYFLNKYFTFQSQGKSFNEIIKFVVNIVCCYFIAYGIAKPVVMATLTDVSKMVQENIAMLVGMVMFVGLNYLGQRFFVFKRKEEAKDK